MSKLNPNVIFNIHVGNFKIGITDTIISMWIVMAIIIIIAWIITLNLKQLPSKKQNIVEIFVDFVKGILNDSMYKHAEHFVPFIGTMLLFIVFANIIDIINIIIPINILVPPTKDINIVLALSLISVIAIIYSGIRFKKVKGWLKSFIEPLPIILPFRIMEYFIKPISLTLRLFGNILAGFLIMTAIYSMVPGVLPSVASIYFDLFDGLLQAYIFVFLVSLYIGEAVEEEI
jgi:F-type H+-transporting ATPase subunit a